MISFFEKDQDEISRGGKIYFDYFNFYPDLNFDAVSRHLNGVDSIAVIDSELTSQGWWVQAIHCEHDFLLDTHFHGTSTLFCATTDVMDEKIMLAFLGCFLLVIRDDLIPIRSGVRPNLHWMKRMMARWLADREGWRRQED